MDGWMELMRNGGLRLKVRVGEGVGQRVIRGELVSVRLGRKTVWLR